MPSLPSYMHLNSLLEVGVYKKSSLMIEVEYSSDLHKFSIRKLMFDHDKKIGKQYNQSPSFI